MNHDLNDSTALLRSTIDSSMDMIQVFKAVRNEAGQIVDFVCILNNKTSERFYGDVIGKSFLVLNPGVAEEGIFDAFKKVVETGEPNQTVRHYMHEQLNGWFLQSLVKQGDGVATTTKDITEFKKAEEQIIISNECLQATLDSSLYVIQAFKAVRDKGGKIIDFTWLFINSKLNQQYGDKVGKSLLAQNSGVIETGLFDKFVQVTETGIALDYEQCYSREQFREKWFHQKLVKMGDGLVMNTEDITDRKKAEQEIREKQVLLESVLNNTESSIMLLKPIRNRNGIIKDFEYIYTNDQTLKSVEFEALVGKRMTEVFPQLKNAELIDIYATVIETGEKFKGEVNILPYGYAVWAQVYAQRFADGVLVTYFDITQRKKTEQQLIDSTELVQTVFDVNINSIAYHKAVRDNHGIIVDFEFQLVNQKAREYSLGDRAGQRYSEVYPGMKDTIVFKKYCNVIETGDNLDTEVELNLKGQNYWFHLMAAKLGDGLVSTAIDVTERKQAHEEILRLKDEIAQHAENKYRMLFNSMDEGYVLAEVVYNEDRQPIDILYLEWNPAASRLTGVADFNQKLLSAVALGAEEYWQKTYHRVVSSGVSERLEKYMKVHDHWYDFYISPFNASANRVTVIFQDITERKQNEQHQAYILKLSDALRPLANSISIQETATTVLGDHLGVHRVFYGELLTDGDTLVFGPCYANTVSPLDGQIEYSEFDSEIMSYYLKGQTVIINDINNDPVISSNKTKTKMAAIEAIAVIGVPLLKEGKVEGVLSIHQAQPRIWKPWEIRLIEETAERTWSALERAKVEQALRESEDLRSIALESGGMGTWHWNIRERSVRASVAFQQLWDVSFKEQPHPVSVYSDKMLPEGAAKLETVMTKDIVPGDEFFDQVKVVKGRTAGRWIEWRGRVDRNRPWIINGVSFDITERKLAEEALRESEERFRTLADTAPALIWQNDANGKNSYVNQYFINYAGRLPGQIQGDGWHGLLHPDEATAYVADYLSAVAERRSWTHRCRIRRYDGVWHWFENYASPLFTKDGNYVGHVGVSTDVNASVVAAESLRKSEEKYRSLFETIDEGFGVIEMLYNEDGKPIDYIFHEVNDAYEKFTGQANPSGKLGSEVSPTIEQYWLDAYNQVVKTGEPIRHESYHGDTGRWYSAFASRIGSDGSRLITVVFDDITERKLAEKRQELLLHISDKLVAADSPKDVQITVTNSLQQHYDAGWCYYVEWDEEKESGFVLHDARKNDLVSLTGTHDVSDVPEFFHILKYANILNVKDYENYKLLSPRIRKRYIAAGVRSMLVASLVKQGKLISSLIIGDTKIRNWSSDDEALLIDVSERAWAAVERAKAEDALRESENRFQLIANLVPDLLWESEPNDSTNWYNDRWLQYTGQRFEEAIGWGWLDAIYPDDRDSSAMHYAEAVETGTLLQLEHRIRRYDGQYRWFVVSVSPVIDKNGKVIKMYGSATDIHDRKQAEQDLLEREKRQAFLLKLSDLIRPLTGSLTIQETVAKELLSEINAGWVYYVTLSEDGAIILTLEGFSKSEPLSLPVGTPLSAFGNIVASSYAKNKMLRYNDTQSMTDFSEEIRTSFRMINAGAFVSVPLIKEGKLVALLSVAVPGPRDWKDAEIELIEEVAQRTWGAVERARAETALMHTQSNYLIQLEKEVRDRTKELHESRDQSQSILNTTLVQMSVLEAIRDAEGSIIDFKIKSVNREFERVTGRIDLIGKHYLQEYPDVKDVGIVDAILETIETGVPQQLEYHQNFEGFMRWFACMFVKYNDGVVATNMDITARKQAEEERLKTYLLLQQSEQIAMMGTWDFHLNTQSFTWSEGMYRLFDIEKETDIKPEFYLKYTTKKGRAVAKKVVAHIVNGDTDFEETLEMNVLGKIKILRIKAAVIRNEFGHAERVLGVDLDITAMQAAEEKIRKMEAEQQLEVFRVSLNNVEEERQRISESLHNGIGQILYGIKLSLSNVTLNASQQEFDRAKKYTNELLTDAIVETRRISHELMPTTLQEFGLKSAIDDVCRQLSDGVQFHCRIIGLYGRLEKYLELAVYRTAQELMTNVVKHAKATAATVQIKLEKQNITIIVSDNGQGISATANLKPGIGLSSIRSKIKLLNGIVSVQSNPGEGTTVEVFIPAQKIKL